MANEVIGRNEDGSNIIDSGEACDRPRVQPIVLKMTLDASQVHEEMDRVEARILRIRDLLDGTDKR